MAATGITACLVMVIAALSFITVGHSLATDEESGILQNF